MRIFCGGTKERPPRNPINIEMLRYLGNLNVVEQKKSPSFSPVFGHWLGMPIRMTTAGTLVVVVGKNHHHRRPKEEMRDEFRG